MISEKSKYYDFISGASLFFALVIAFWIPSYRWVLSDFIAGWILFSILELNFGKRLKQNLTTNYAKILFALQILLFLVVLSNIFFADDINKVSKNILQKLSLFVFPFLFALSNKKFKENKTLFLKLFVLSNFLMSLICLGVAFYNSLSFAEGKIIFNPVFSVYKNYFIGSDFSVFHHRGYFSMYIVFALALLFYFDEKQKMFDNKTKKILYFFLIAFFSLMIFLLSSRAGLLSVFILFSVQIIRKIYISKNIFYKISAPVLIFFMLVLVFTNKRIKKTVDKLLTSEEIKKQDKEIKTPARIYLWKASAELIKENFPGGTGYEKFQNRFNEKYSEISGRDMTDVKKINLNAHNQFLEMFVKYGLFGFLILSAFFLYPVFISFKNKNYLFLAFLLITGFNFLFESVLNTLAGIVFFAFFYNYFIFVFDDNPEQQKTVLNEKN